MAEQPFRHHPPSEVSQRYANNDSLPRTASTNFLKIAIVSLLRLPQVAF